MFNTRRNKKEMKTLESKFKKGMGANEIVNACGMSGRPEYYSGRGANISDLNFEMLERIYTGIKASHGINAGEEFVQMVADIPKLSATDFLVNLYNLEGNNWNWDKRMVRDESGVYVGGITDDQKFVSGYMAIMGVMSGMNNRDETRYIRGQFLANHGVKSEQDSRQIIIGPDGEYFG